MKVSVLYRSMTGHSKKLAKAVAEELGVEAVNIKKKPGLMKADMLIIVGGIYAGKSLKDMTEFAKLITPETAKKVALITSSAAGNCGQDEVRAILAANGVEVLDEYRCTGGFLFLKLRHPDKTEISGAREFAKKIAQK